MYDRYATLIPMTRNEEAARAAVREARDGLGWTNRVLAEKAGVNYDTVNDFLIRDTWPRPATQERIEVALGWESGRIEQIASIGERGVNVTPSITQTDESLSASGDQPRALFNWLSQAAKEGYTEDEIAEIEARALAIALQAAREIRAARPQA